MSFRPGSWKTLRITDIAEFGSGTLISVARLSERSPATPVPVFGGNGIAGYTSSATVYGPTVILGRVGQRCGVVYRNSSPAWITDNALYARRFKRQVDVQFLALALEAARLNDVRNRNDLPLITQTILRDVKITLPESVEEQRHIAKAVSAADDHIAALEHTIAKKRAIQQGMMQQLLGGSRDRTRMVPLGSLASWLSGGTPNRSNLSYWSGTIPWISATTLKTLQVATSDQHVTPVAVRAGSKMAPHGSTLLLVRGSALHSEIRASLVTGPVCFNQDIRALVPSHKLVPKFLTYSIHGNADRLLRLVTSAGNSAGVLDTQLVKRFEIWLPSHSEQRRIVTILDDIWNDIAATAVRLAKATAIKEGMMQELLSGRIRLLVAETVA